MGIIYSQIGGVWFLFAWGEGIMNYGIKFCGGCNPRYDRRQACSQIVTTMEAQGGSWEYAKDGQVYDKLIVLCGCSSQCANVEPYGVREEKLYLYDELHVQQFKI